MLDQFTSIKGDDEVNATGTQVAVGCKLPSGLILRVYRPHQANTPDGKTVTSFVPLGDPVQLNGSNSSRVIGGFGITLVDADFFDLWESQNGEYDPVKAGLIFKASDPRAAASMATERAAVVNGMEPTDPTKMGAKLQPVG